MRELTKEQVNRSLNTIRCAVKDCQNSLLGPYTKDNVLAKPMPGYVVLTTTLDEIRNSFKASILAQVDDLLKEMGLGTLEIYADCVDDAKKTGILDDRAFTVKLDAKRNVVVRGVQDLNNEINETFDRIIHFVTVKREEFHKSQMNQFVFGIVSAVVGVVISCLSMYKMITATDTATKRWLIGLAPGIVAIGVGLYNSSSTVSDKENELRNIDTEVSKLNEVLQENIKVLSKALDDFIKELPKEENKAYLTEATKLQKEFAATNVPMRPSNLKTLQDYNKTVNRILHADDLQADQISCLYEI